jgi:hypothetical protein
MGFPIKKTRKKTPEGCLPRGSALSRGPLAFFILGRLATLPSASSGRLYHRREAIDASAVPHLDRVIAGHTRVEELTSALVEDGVAGDASTLGADHAVVAVAVASDRDEGGNRVVARVDVHVSIVVCWS